MLGRFLEFSLATPDIQASLDFYAELGFSAAEVGEAWTHPYAVVTDGRICLGLASRSHPRALPDLRQTRSAQACWSNSRGGESNLSSAISAMTCSTKSAGSILPVSSSGSSRPAPFRPASGLPPRHSRCGYFLEIAIPAPDRELAKAYWEDFGFVGMDELADRLPHITCTSDFIDLGLVSSGGSAARNPAFRSRRCGRYSGASCRCGNCDRRRIAAVAAFRCPRPCWWRRKGRRCC